MTIHAIFPTPIYEHVGTVEETFLVQHEIKNFLPKITTTDEFNNPPGWDDGVKTNIKLRYNTIVDFQMKNLENYIESHVKKYIQSVGAWEPMPNKLAHSWINFVETGARQDWHQHQDAVIAGTYYYQTSEDDGDIVFRTPNQFVELELFPLGSTVDKFYNIKPKVGKIVLFPGWLAHSVRKNTQDNTRISISFNYMRDNFAARTETNHKNNK
jgi:uncharacterized protein (TIGR02466 family)